jgi:hypothetical protein
MTLRLKDIVVWLALLAIFPLGVSVFVALAGPAQPPSEWPAPPLGPTLGDPPPTHVDAAPVAITFIDESRAWTWSNRCQVALGRFIADNNYPLRQVTLSLVDSDPTLPLGVVYPDPAEPDALVFTGCRQQGEGLACQVSLGAGRPGSSLDTAMTVALAYGIQEHFRPRTRELWEAGRGWDWAVYQPLVEQAGTVWLSTCMEVKGSD